MDSAGRYRHGPAFSSSSRHRTGAGALGCHRFLARTQSQFSNILAPVNPDAGPVRPIVVQGGIVCRPRGARRRRWPDSQHTLCRSHVGRGKPDGRCSARKLQAIQCDPCVKAVVVRLNSPGGGVAACLTMRRDLQRFKECTHLPVVACMMDECTGGAYVIASAADVVVSGTGDRDRRDRRHPQPVQSPRPDGPVQHHPADREIGGVVDIGTSARALDPAERECSRRWPTISQATGTGSLAVASRREPGRRQDVRRPHLHGGQALARGLVDQIGDLDEAIQIAARLACPNVQAQQLRRPQVVMYRRNNDPATSIYVDHRQHPLAGGGTAAEPSRPRPLKVAHLPLVVGTGTDHRKAWREVRAEKKSVNFTQHCV